VNHKPRLRLDPVGKGRIKADKEETEKQERNRC
jgi:hypothetical protein